MLLNSEERLVLYLECKLLSAVIAWNKVQGFCPSRVMYDIPVSSENRQVLAGSLCDQLENRKIEGSRMHENT